MRTALVDEEMKNRRRGLRGRVLENHKAFRVRSLAGRGQHVSLSLSISIVRSVLFIEIVIRNTI